MTRKPDIFVTFNGKHMDLNGWAEEFNTSYIRLYKRLEKQRNDFAKEFPGEPFKVDVEKLFQKLEVRPFDPTKVYVEE